MKSKLLFVVDDFYPVISAPAVRINSFIDALSNYSINIIGGNSAEVYAQNGYHFYNISRPNEKKIIKFIFFLLKINFKAIIIAIKIRPKVSVISIPKYELLLAVPIIKLFSKGLVIDIRDSYNFINYSAYFKHFFPKLLANFIGKSAKLLVKLIFNFSLSLANKVTVANRGIYETLGKYKRKVIIVSNGVDTEKFKPDNKLKKKEDILNLVYMGNFAEKDDFNLLYGLDEEVRKKITINLIGDGRNRIKILSQLKENGLNFNYLGIVVHAQIPQVLSTMDAGIIFRERGVNESIPVVIYEFCSMSIPTISNNVGLMSDFIKSKGLGEIVLNSIELNILLKQIINDKTYFKKYECLHELAVKYFSRLEQAKIFKQTIESIIKSF